MNTCIHLTGVSAVKVLNQQILPAQYRDVVGDKVVNLAAVLQDTASREHALASEEFNVASPQLIIKVLSCPCSKVLSACVTDSN